MKQFRTFTMMALFAALAFSCSDDEVIDVRAQAVGNYNYVFDTYYLDNGKLVSLDVTDNGTFSVATDPANENGLIITEATTKFTANKVTAASNGFTFDIPAQLVKDDDGTSLSISGYNGAQLTTTGGSSTLYNGMYISSTQKFTFYFQVVDASTGITIVFEMVGTKK